VSTDDWLQDRVAHLKGLKSATDAQRLMILLAEKSQRTPAESKKLSLLVNAERTAERATKARAAASKFLRAEQQAEASKARKARDHALYQSAGLLILAGLVDSKTGEPTRDRGAMLGALVGLGTIPTSDQRWASWKAKGDALLAQRQSQPKDDASEPKSEESMPVFPFTDGNLAKSSIADSVVSLTKGQSFP
jgi:hypothetical protein